jgi:hypothetical protein
VESRREKTRDESRRMAVREEEEYHGKGQAVKRGNVNLMKVFYFHI